MAWTLANKSFQVDNSNQVVIEYGARADASDLTGEIILDLSAYIVQSTQAAPSKCRIASLIALVSSGVHLTLDWDRTTDRHIMDCPGGVISTYAPLPIPTDETSLDNIFDDTASGDTGDVIATTIGGGLGEGFQIWGIFEVA